MVDKNTAAVLYRLDDLRADAGRQGRATETRTDGPEITHILGAYII